MLGLDKMIIDMTTEVIKLRLKNETIDPVLANDYLQLAEEEKSLRDRHQIAQDILHKKAGEIAKYLEAKTSCHCEDSDTEQSEVEEDAAISNEPSEKQDATA